MNSPFKDDSSLVFPWRLLFGAWEDEETSARAIPLLEFSNKTCLQGMTRLFQGPGCRCSIIPGTVLAVLHFRDSAGAAPLFQGPCRRCSISETVLAVLHFRGRVGGAPF